MSWMARIANGVSCTKFAGIGQGSRPDVITMENVPTVAKHEVFHDFVDTLKKLGYNVWFDIVDSSQYGVPQNRRRMVLLASRHGEIKMIEPTVQKPRQFDKQSVACASYAPVSLRPETNYTLRRRYRVRIYSASKHRSPAVHGVIGLSIWWLTAIVLRLVAPILASMGAWSGTACTNVTTQCYGFGNGRFGHPVQDRAISLREAAIIQSFPRDYAFIPDDGEIKTSRCLGASSAMLYRLAWVEQSREASTNTWHRSFLDESLSSLMPPFSPHLPKPVAEWRKVRQKGTGAEIALRRKLYQRGLRYRVGFEVLKKPRRVADIAFPGRMIAVFVDGCFWHGCPRHATWPKQNSEFWRKKIRNERNQGC